MSFKILDSEPQIYKIIDAFTDLENFFCLKGDTFIHSAFIQIESPDKMLSA